MPSDPTSFIAGLVDELVPVTPLRQRNGMARAVLALMGGAAGIVLLFGLRPDLMAGRPAALPLLSAGLFLVLALASAWAVIDMARPQVGLRRDGWGWNAVMAGLLPGFAALVMGVNLLQGAPSGLADDGIQCLQNGLISGLLTAAALVLWLRRGAPAELDRAGLMTGVAAGSAGIFAVSLYCPHSDLVHIGIWHGLTVVLSGLLGRLTIPRLIRW